MPRRAPSTIDTLTTGWRRTARSAVEALSTTDGRWAIVSTSVTALVAGSIAWLAMGTMPPATSHGFGMQSDRALMPYQLFLRLASQGNPGNDGDPGATGDAGPPAINQ